VIGTSLQVAPIADITGYFPRHVPQILINKKSVAPKLSVSNGFDLELLGDCDDIVSYLSQAVGIGTEFNDAKQPCCAHGNISCFGSCHVSAREAVTNGPLQEVFKWYEH
jgi:hypothetical protein